MRISQITPLRTVRRSAGFARKVFRRGTRRRLACLGLILSLLMWPGPTVGQLPALASTLIDAASDTVRSAPPFVKWFFRRRVAARRPETLADRIAAVSAILISPQRFVGYQAQTVTFRGLPTDLAGRTIQGVRFTWESANPDKVQIDDSGNATFLQPGLTTIICRAGLITAIARVLVKPGQRRLQTEAEWNADQESLIGDGRSPDDGPTGVASALSSLLENLAPTAYAQGGGGINDFLYDELWSEPRNLTGSPRNRVIEPTRIGAVLPEGSNFEFAVPIESLGGRGLGSSLTLHYNSRVWSRHGSAVTFNAVNGWPFAGFSLGFGRIVTYGTPSSTKYVLVDSEGTRRYLGVGSSSTTATYQTADGSHITFVGSATNGGTMYFNNGTSVTITVVNNLLLPTQITDSNGNYEQIAYKPSYQGFAPLAIDYVTDSLARVIQFQYDSNFNLTSITAPGVGGTTENPVTRTLAQFDYQSRSLTYNFSGLTVENATSGQTLNTLRHVYFPVTQTGYLFSFSDYGMIYNVSLRRQMTIDGNGVISDGIDSADVSFNYPTSGSTQVTDAPAFTQRTETPGGTFNYSTSPGFQTTTFNVARPDASTLSLTRSTNGASVANGLLTQSEVKNSGGASMAKSVIAYANDPGGSPQVQSVISYDDATPTPNQTKVDFDYDSYGNVTNKREYGFQSGGSWLVRRRTRNVYKTDTAYINAYLRSLVIERDLYDAQLDTSDANDVLIAKSTYTLDDYNAMGGMENYGGSANPPGHLSSYNTSVTVRGNVTGTTGWYDLTNNLSITRLRKVDIFGNVTREQLACCSQVSFTCTETNCWGVPEVITSGATGGPQQTTTDAYDFNTSLVTSQTSPDNQTTTVNYDQFLRPTSETLPTGATVTRIYNDQALSLTTTTNYFDGFVNKTLTTSEVYDGWLRVIQKVDTGGGQVNTSYDAMGRVQSVTNPFTQGGPPGPATTVQYDALGRPTIRTLPDNNTVQETYNGSIVTTTDQVNRKIQRQTDGLGRLVTVNEQDATGALTQSTTHSYDYLDGLTLVNQGNQTRSFKYDALKRLLYERIPEQSATINDGTGTFWSSKYTYTDFSKVATRTDARGVVTSYSYDTLNRLTSVSYNTAGAPGVAATSTVMYTYGSGTQLKSVGACNEFYESYGYDQYNRVSSVDRFIQGRRYGSSYQYNQINQRTQATEPGGTLSLQYDNKARLTAVGSYLTSTAYNAAAQVTGFTLGNGVTEAFGYDTNRLQMTSETATAPGGPTGGLMNLSYSYQAAAGQMGAGTTAGNASQLISMSGTINGTTESAGYTYNNVSSVVSSSQTSNGSSSQRRFIYDRWGNRTSMWDAVSGGNQIQSIALEQSGGVPTNRIQSVTTTGAVNYFYDAAGNVTNDGPHSYTYDAENRLVSVDGGATAQYAYDYNNRRIVKQVGPAKTDCLYDGNQEIEEHDGSSSNAGALLVRYIYSGSGIIAKVDNGLTRYFLNDKLSARVMLDAGGNVIGLQAHFPFGEDFAESGTLEKHHFTSYERDSETGLDYAVNRYHSSAVGRFASVDPVLERAITRQVTGCGATGKIPLRNVASPQQWSRYSYTVNDPVNRSDPLGLEDESFLGEEIDSALSLLSGDGDGDLSPLSAVTAADQSPECAKCCRKQIGKCTRNLVICLIGVILAGVRAILACITGPCGPAPIGGLPLPPFIRRINCIICIGLAVTGIVSGIAGCFTIRNLCFTNTNTACGSIPDCKCTS
jgi:RHS repeat-associated protein